MPTFRAAANSLAFESIYDGAGLTLPDSVRLYEYKMWVPLANFCFCHDDVFAVLLRMRHCVSYTTYKNFSEEADENMGWVEYRILSYVKPDNISRIISCGLSISETVHANYNAIALAHRYQYLHGMMNARDRSYHERIIAKRQPLMPGCTTTGLGIFHFNIFKNRRMAIMNRNLAIVTFDDSFIRQMMATTLNIEDGSLISGDSLYRRRNPRRLRPINPVGAVLGTQENPIELDGAEQDAIEDVPPGEADLPDERNYDDETMESLIVTDDNVVEPPAVDVPGVGSFPRDAGAA